jgi:hypothetical protein
MYATAQTMIGIRRIMEIGDVGQVITPAVSIRYRHCIGYLAGAAYRISVPPLIRRGHCTDHPNGANEGHSRRSNARTQKNRLNNYGLPIH